MGQTPDNDMQPDELTVTSLDGGRRASGARRRRARVAGAAVLLVLLAAGALIWYWPALLASRRQTGAPLSVRAVLLNLSDAHLSCARSSAWSPDGKTIAVVGSQCANAFHLTDSLALYDASSGKLRSQFALDAPIVARAMPSAIQSSPKLLQNLSTYFSTVVWSPDGRHIALTFDANYLSNEQAGNAPPPTDVTGIETVDISTRQEQVLLDKRIPANSTSPSSLPQTWFESQLTEEWDLHTGTSRYLSLPPAQAYTWNADGTLKASARLPTSSAGTPAAPVAGGVGNPTGSGRFTVWQSGSLAYAAKCGPVLPDSGPPQPLTYSPTDYYSLSLYTPAWSPDGRYFIPYLGVVARLAEAPAPPTNPSATTPTKTTKSTTGRQSVPNTIESCGYPTRDEVPAVAARDSGLRQALRLVALNTAPDMNVVWRRDGAQVVVLPYVYSASDPAVVIYNTSSGRALLRLPFAELPSVDYFSTVPNHPAIQQASWSPDGSHLLLMPNEAHVLLVYDTQSLESARR